MPLFRKFSLGATGRANLNFNTVSGSAPLNGQSYMSAPVNGFIAAFASSGSAASDAYIGGFRYTSGGALRIYDATAGDPSPLLVNQGIAVTSDGQVCVSNGVNTTYTNLNGIAVSPTGVVFVNNLSFALEFSDLGAGVVSTVEAIGGATPTFTRATSAWTILSDGTWGLVASGSPRSYYSPSGTYLGYLAEGARTNLVVQSQDFNTTWSAVGTPTFSADTTTLGALNLDTIGDDSAAALEGYTQAITFTGDAVKAISLFVKQGTSISSVIRVRDTTAAADRLLVAITWSSGTPVVTVTTGTDLTGTPVAYGNSGVYRISLATTSVTAANTNQIEVYPATDAALAVTGVGTIQAGGVQAENATFASSYIPTTTAAVTRNADSLSYPSTILNASAGTMFAQFTPLQVISLGEIVRHLPTSGNFILRQNNAEYDGFYGDKSSAQAGVFSIGSSAKVALAYSGSESTQVVNGSTQAIAAATAPVFNAAANVFIGESGAGALQLYGVVRRVAYFGSRLSNAELQAITSG